MVCKVPLVRQMAMTKYNKLVFPVYWSWNISSLLLPAINRCVERPKQSVEKDEEIKKKEEKVTERENGCEKTGLGKTQIEDNKAPCTKCEIRSGSILPALRRSLYEEAPDQLKQKRGILEGRTRNATTK